MHRVEPQIVRRVLCGVYRLMPSELGELPLYDIYILLDAYYYNKLEEQDYDYRLTAWQTSLLINTCGKVKKKVQPKHLYKGIDVYENLSKNGKEGRVGKDVKKYVENERSKLKEIFKLN